VTRRSRSASAVLAATTSAAPTSTSRQRRSTACTSREIHIAVPRSPTSAPSATGWSTGVSFAAMDAAGGDRAERGACGGRWSAVCAGIALLGLMTVHVAVRPEHAWVLLATCDVAALATAAGLLLGWN